MIDQAIQLIECVIVGAALGALYFGGLWLTVRRLPEQSNPMLWLLASTMMRLALLIAFFYLVTQGAWDKLAACLLGFIATRAYLLRRARPSRTATTAS